MNGNDQKYSSSIFIATLSAATITSILMLILRYTNGFTRPVNIIEKIAVMSTNHSAFFAYAICILIISMICAFGYGIIRFTGEL